MKMLHFCHKRRGAVPAVFTIIFILVLIAGAITYFLNVFGTSPSKAPEQPEQSISRGFWIGQSNGQFTLNKYSESVKPLFVQDDSTNCASFEKMQSYHGVLFDTGPALENNFRGRLNLAYENKTILPVNKRARFISAFALGNTGNVYPESQKYVYQANVFLDIVYADGKQERIKAILPWDWTAGDSYAGIGATTIYLKASPCSGPNARGLYLMKYGNPFPEKEIASITFEDDFTSYYPRTNIFAVTLSDTFGVEP